MAKVRGSKDGKIIKASFKGQAKSLFPTLKQTKLLVLLSIIGNEFCSGNYLRSIIQTATFTHEFTTFLIADEVYWHNLRRDFSKEEELALKRKAIEMGADYFERNLEHFLFPLGITKEAFNEQHADKSIHKKLSILNDLAMKHSNYEVILWNDWLNKNHEFQSIKKPLIDLFEKEKSLKKSIEQMASNFASRHQTDDKPYDLLMKRSCSYLVEETPGVIWIAASLGYHFIGYPGEMIKPFKAAKEYFIRETDDLAVNEFGIYVDEPKLLVNWLEITFQRCREKQEKSSIAEDHAYSITSEILKGVTQGIFSLEIDSVSKVKMLVDVIEEYQSRKANVLENVQKEHQEMTNPGFDIQKINI
ncbi:hypothetical protein [Legionella oakridgensis]|uniref:Uncharacterized protein n=2 Tax=Legionella oakridgensis TaxID=29423 RepID=W0BDC7_9GAMM|nr:hypothetical protein [Legionella oakridgensis]AHE67855.1 hypothetical protein Loa_02313 [Legionella oakridgensis ATCC 33761 = DSM 21215]ETO92494.1 hypothetical protein LOR_63c15800 [Legionella oakridgensis RV-2-2007]KTD38683.1 hypothetical protein Loak_1171 [Legionella oakridgensis]STY20867.1 Uncharacterised protein [Legionella longbeachae]